MRYRDCRLDGERGDQEGIRYAKRERRQAFVCRGQSSARSMPARPLRPWLVLGRNLGSQPRTVQATLECRRWRSGSYVSSLLWWTGNVSWRHAVEQWSSTGAPELDVDMAPERENRISIFFPLHLPRHVSCAEDGRSRFFTGLFMEATEPPATLLSPTNQRLARLPTRGLFRVPDIPRHDIHGTLIHHV